MAAADIPDSPGAAEAAAEDILDSLQGLGILGKQERQRKGCSLAARNQPAAAGLDRACLVAPDTVGWLAELRVAVKGKRQVELPRKDWVVGVPPHRMGWRQAAALKRERL